MGFKACGTCSNLYNIAGAYCSHCGAKISLPNTFVEIKEQQTERRRLKLGFFFLGGRCSWLYHHNLRQRGDKFCLVCGKQIGKEEKDDNLL